MESVVVKRIRESVQPSSNPAVYISGGIDSTVVLHHLTEKIPGNKIRTYTAKFDSPLDTDAVAEKIARYYGTIHRTVNMTQFDYVSDLPHILTLFRNPQWNGWIWYLAREAGKDGVENVYLGEWGDEIFGYPDRNCLEAYAGQILRITPMYVAVHSEFKILVHMPFSNLEPCLKSRKGWHRAFQLWFSEDKKILRQAYKLVLPVEVQNLITPCQPPAFTDYVNIGRIYLKRHFPDEKLDTPYDVKNKLWAICVEALFHKSGERPFSERY